MTPKEAFSILNGAIDTYSDEKVDEAKDVVSKALNERDLYKEMSDIYRRNYQVQMCLNDRLRLIEIEKELGL